MSLPTALRLPHRPLTLAVLQLLATSLFKPYPSLADMAAYLALLPLLQQQLVQMRRHAFLLVNSYGLLLLLGPAMWHQWIQVGGCGLACVCGEVRRG